MTCQKCGSAMEHMESERDTNVAGGWVCCAAECDEFIPDSDVDNEP